MGFWRNQLSGPTDPAADAAWDTHEPRKGFFTDTSICIGCKACEVACKEWNGVPEDGLDLLNQSYDNTGALGASTWRHVAFVEQTSDRIELARESGRKLVSLGMPSVRSADEPALAGGGGTVTATLTAPCADGHPGAGRAVADGLRRVQALHPCRLPGRVPHGSPVPYRVRHRRRAGRRLQRLRLLRGGLPLRRHRAPERSRGPREGPAVPRHQHQGVRGHRGNGQPGRWLAPEPAVARRDERRGQERRHRPEVHALLRPAGSRPDSRVRPGLPHDVDQVRRPRRDASDRPGPGRPAARAGYSEARLYGVDENDGVGGTGSTFLLLDEPEVYGLPPDPRVTTADLPDMFRKAGYAGLTMLAMAAASFVGRRK